MTFGQTLKQMLSVGGVKMARLADALGYDTSYVSRWVNGLKMPSLRNNSDLFRKIARAIAENSDVDGRQQLARRFAGEEEKLETALAGALRAAYSGSLPVGRAEAAMTCNAVYLPAGLARAGLDLFVSAVIRAAQSGGTGTVHCVTTMPLRRGGAPDAGFFEAVLASPDKPENLRLFIHRLVDMADFAENTDVYCAAICVYVCHEPGIVCDFYEFDPPAGAWARGTLIIEDKLLYQSLDNPLMGRESAMVCYDGSVIAETNAAAMARLSATPKILTRDDWNEQSTRRFLYDYIMNGSIRYFLSIMHPIFMEDELAAELAARYAGDVAPEDFQFYFNSLCAQAPKEVVIYRSAVLDYIYAGRILLFGRVLMFAAEDRARHLMQLIRNIEEGKCRLTILDDDNPLLNRADTRISFYLSAKSAFMADCDGRTIRLRSQRAAEYFTEFFRHFQQLGAAWCLEDRAALDFIRRGLDFMGTVRD